jgi:serine protease Do
MAIRSTLRATQSATFAVLLPDPGKHDLPSPVGTGFFVSSDGWFVTAAHVLMDQSSGSLRSDLGGMCLEKEMRWDQGPPAPGCCAIAVAHVDPQADFALLRVDFAANAQRDWLSGASGFPFITVSTRVLEEGEPIYAFGYPLSESDIVHHEPGAMIIGQTWLRPRVT